MSTAGSKHSPRLRQPPLGASGTLQAKGQEIAKTESLESTLVHAPLHLKTFPQAISVLCVRSFPSQPRSLSTSPGKMSARPGQAYACINGTHRGRRKNPGPGRGIWHPINPVTALRTLKLTLGFLSETRGVYEPSPSMPMAAHPARNCMPTLELAQSPARLGSLRHLPVVTLH